MRIDTSLTVHQPGLAKELAGEELQVEACLFKQEVGHGLVEVDGNKDTLTLWLYRDGVVDMPLWIYHRIETRQVARGIGIAKCGDNLSAFNAAAQLLRHGLPLTGRRLQPDVAIGGNTMSIHNHADTALMSFWVEVTECHHVCPAGIKVAVAVQPECLCRSHETCHD